MSARREELTLRALFNEELGAIVQVPTARRDEVIALLRAARPVGRLSHVIGKTNDARRRRGLARREDGRSAPSSSTCSRPGTR